MHLKCGPENRIVYPLFTSHSYQSFVHSIVLINRTVSQEKHAQELKLEMGNCIHNLDFVLLLKTLLTFHTEK